MEQHTISPNTMNRKFLYKFQPKDDRDHIFSSVPHPTNAELHLASITIPLKNSTSSRTMTANPSSFVISNTSGILDQGSLGACVCNAFSFAINTQTRSTTSPAVLSRLYMYAICRILDNNGLNNDCGTTIRTACNSIKNYGIVNESSYPYNISLFSKLPQLTTIQSSKIPKAISYTFVTQDLASLKSCLNTYKLPIVFGFMVYTSFLTAAVASTGNVPMPNVSKERLEGGHCMCVIGYDDSKQTFTCVNSWGTGWGNKGLCYIPYNYLTNSSLAGDFCFISQLNI